MPECISLQPGLSARAPAETVLALGNFDGVHLGHRALLERAVTLRQERFPKAALGVFCFREQSSDFLFPNPPGHLCSLAEKLERFRDAGMEYVFLGDFPALRYMDAESFAREILREECHAVAAVCGFNYRFGIGGTGTPTQLEVALGAPVEVCPEVCIDGETVSSTRIRRLLARGQVEDANRLLSLPFSFSAPVLHGKALGRKLGSPTINQRIPAGLQLPLRGVYVTECTVGGVSLRGVTNVGVRPTVDANEEVNCETYLLDFDREIYGETVKTAFLHFLRPEKSFSDLNALRQQIECDIRVAKEY